MRHLLPSGVWELFVPGLGEGERYKFEIRTPAGHLLHKVDPYGRYFEVPPRSAAIVCRTEGYAWGDDRWMAERLQRRVVAEASDEHLRGAPGVVAHACPRTGTGR